MSNNGNPCWICGAYLEPGNPCDFIGSVSKFECRRCQAELEKKTPAPVEDTEAPDLADIVRSIVIQSRACDNEMDYEHGAFAENNPKLHKFIGQFHDGLRALASDRERLQACVKNWQDSAISLRSRLEIAERDTVRLDWLLDAGLIYNAGTVTERATIDEDKRDSDALEGREAGHD